MDFSNFEQDSSRYSINIMKVWVYTIAVFVLADLFVPAAGGAVNTSVRNPSLHSRVGTGRVPLGGSRRSGLIRSRNPIDRSSNRVVTGNVAGGRHFRGTVPYNAISNFEASAGSTYLDDFLRRSAGAGRVAPGSYRPYYSTSGTVTRFSGKSRAIVSPGSSQVSSKIDGRRYGSQYNRGSRDFYEAQQPGRRYRPLSWDLSEMEDRILLQQGGYEQTNWQPDRQADETELSRPEDVSEKTEKSQDRLKRQEKWWDKDSKPEKEGKKTGSGQHKTDEEQAAAYDASEQLRREFTESSLQDVYEGLQRQLEMIRTEMVQETGEEETEAESENAAGIGEPGKETPTSESTDKSPYGAGSGEETRRTNLVVRNLEFIDETLNKIDASVRARGILGENKTFASLHYDKFNKYMKAAERYMAAGEYYRAADAYTLASIYKDNAPLAYAGRSHALLGAGEYMSSSLFLARALEAFPGYAGLDVDLAGMIGDIDKLESRIADIRQWLDISDAGELHLLLAYIYYQTNKTGQAKVSIEKASEKMPDSAAVMMLKRAIEKTH